MPVSASLGNGDNPATNLYWGAAFGVKTFFGKSKDWELVSRKRRTRSPAILERLIFKTTGNGCVYGRRRLSRQRNFTSDLGFSEAASGQGRRDNSSVDAGHEDDRRSTRTVAPN